ncbi:type II secretion system F family protein [Egicoccus sp. AB-alg6-2]|uniref:type II secretion system F family protein n=1 Tax=Egicoccus sp. AB-alg6-2 TaxID=3242692 RepID=UPI00359EEFE5
MSTLVALLAGIIVGIGIWLAIGGLAGWQLLPDRSQLAASTARLQQTATRAGLAVLVAMVVLVVTRWPVAAALAGFGTALAPRLLGGGRARQDAIDKTEAIASWAESVRDTMAAAAGLEEALTATAVAPPAPIAPAVRRLAERLRHQRLTDALAAFGDELDHPSSDLVVAALTIAARMEAADLGSLLSRLAESIRDDATMRVKVEVGRQRLRTSAKIILGSVVATVIMLMVLNRSYLDAYDSPGGQAVLAVVGGVFAGGSWLMARMSDIDLPERFVPRTTQKASR